MAMSEQARQRAQAIQQSHDAAQKRIAGRQDLSPAAKQTLQARAYRDHKNQIDELKLTTAGADAARRSQLVGRLFGVTGVAGDATTNALSWRDAQQRVNEITDPSVASQMLARAHDAGDEMLVRSIGQRANDLLKDPQAQLFGSGWGDVLQQFADSRPHTVGDLNELDDLQRNGTARAIRDAANLVLPAPPGVPANNSAALEALANDQRFAGVQ